MLNRRVRYRISSMLEIVGVLASLVLLYGIFIADEIYPVWGITVVVTLLLRFIIWFIPWFIKNTDLGDKNPGGGTDKGVR